MWTWFGIAILTRVLMASNEADLQYELANSLTDGNQMTAGEDVLDGDGESLTQTSKTAKPKSSKIETKWNNDQHVYRDHNLRPYEKTISNLIRKLSGSSDSTIFQKELEDQRDKRSSIKNTNATPPVPWVSWITLENKALPFRDGQDPWHEIKKSRAFSPWGGKRVTGVYGQGLKVRRPIRVPFNSWGGKRSFSDEQKRTRFSSWGGKRGWYLNTAENSLENGIEKRTRFNAWGGKRSKNGEVADEEIKRTRFNAWGGKRSDKYYKREPEETLAKKNVFNAWGGKRFYNMGDDEDGNDGERGAVELKNIVDDKKYYKKEEEEGENEEETNEINDDNMGNNEIPSESEIAMKLPSEKRGAFVDKAEKSSFNPWGGKKKRSEDNELIGQGFDLINPESDNIQGHHHERFWSWGG